MDIAQIIRSVFADNQTQAILTLVALDLVLGVCAALKPPTTFRLTYVANFARNDVLGKLVPFIALDAAAAVAGGMDVVGTIGGVGIDLTTVSHAAFALVAAAMVGSIISSLKDLGLDVFPPALGRGAAPPAG